MSLMKGGVEVMCKPGNPFGRGVMHNGRERKKRTSARHGTVGSVRGSIKQSRGREASPLRRKGRHGAGVEKTIERLKKK